MAQLILGTPYNQLLLRDLNDPSLTSTLGSTRQKQKVKAIHLTSDDTLFYSSASSLYFIQSEFKEQTQRVTNYESEPIGMFHEGKEDIVISGLKSGKVLMTFDKSKQEGNSQNWEDSLLYDYSKQKGKKFDNKTQQGFAKMVVSSDKKTVCMVGKKVLPFVFDLTHKTVVWEGKNVPNDQLDLQVPIYDTDVKFFDNHSPISLHYYKKIRLYDIRNNKKRPALDSPLKTPYNEHTNFFQQSPINVNLFFVSTDLGNIYQCDRRRGFQVIGKFKSTPNASISAMVAVSNYLLACGLDGYLRAFDGTSKQLQRKVFVNRAVSAIGINSQEEFELKQIEEQVQGEQGQIDNKDKGSKIKKIRKRNKVGLAYLRISKEEVKIEQNQNSHNKRGRDDEGDSDLQQV